MKIIIWLMCIFCASALNTYLGMNGVINGGLQAAFVTILSYTGAISLARQLCKDYDEKRNRKMDSYADNDKCSDSINEIKSDNIFKRNSTALLNIKRKAASSKICRNNREIHCKICGGIIDYSTKKCEQCGKQYFKLRLNVMCVVAILFVAVVGYTIINYTLAISAMNNQEFLKSRQFFDNLFVSEKLFPDKYAYVRAGTFYEEGKYLKAYKEFLKNDEYSIPSNINDRLQSEIYFKGVKAYRDGDNVKALHCFELVPNYERSADYLFLLYFDADTLKGSLLREHENIKLIKMLDFENAKELVLKRQETALPFLAGRWENGDRYDPMYFELANNTDNYSSSYNLPHKNKEGYFYFAEGVYSIGETEYETTKIYKFSIIDEDTIRVYCFKDGSTYVLYRQ